MEVVIRYNKEKQNNDTYLLGRFLFVGVILMKQKIMAFLLIILLVGSFFSGCSQSEGLELKVCGAYSAPGMMHPDLKGNASQYQVIEEDAQGRILFRFTTLNVITEQNETALIICQHKTKDTVFYYEDICYLYEPASEENIDVLKQANDWGQELNFDKMTSRPIKYSSDLVLQTDDVLDYKKIKDAYCRSNNVDPAQIQEMVLLDVDPSGMELHYLTLERNGMKEKYFVIANLSYETFSCKSNGELSDLAQLPQFKADHGWSKGTA